jgi:hypothetical protein
MKQLRPPALASRSESPHCIKVDKIILLPSSLLHMFSSAISRMAVLPRCAVSWTRLLYYFPPIPPARTPLRPLLIFQQHDNVTRALSPLSRLLQFKFKQSLLSSALSFSLWEKVKQMMMDPFWKIGGFMVLHQMHVGDTAEAVSKSAKVSYSQTRLCHAHFASY